MNDTELGGEKRKSNEELSVATTTSAEINITQEEFSKLTFRQKFVVTEYGYLLSPEDAEEVGKMLGNFVQEKDIHSFCQTNGKKVYGQEQNKTTTNDVNNFLLIVGVLLVLLLWVAFGGSSVHPMGKAIIMTFVILISIAGLVGFLIAVASHHNKGKGTSIGVLVGLVLGCVIATFFLFTCAFCF